MSAIYTAVPAASATTGSLARAAAGAAAGVGLDVAELLMLTHLVAAAIVIPAVARRLGA
jgi:hypothetical protein